MRIRRTRPVEIDTGVLDVWPDRIDYERHETTKKEKAVEMDTSYAMSLPLVLVKLWDFSSYTPFLLVLPF
jgi:hypothetical protein